MDQETHEQLIARTVAQTAADTAKAVSEAATAAAQILAERGTAVSSSIAVLKTELSNMKDQQIFAHEAIERRMNEQRASFKEIFNKLDEIAQGRPTWAMAIIMGAESSLIVGLVVFLMSHR